MIVKRLINWFSGWGGPLGSHNGQQIGLPTEPVFSGLEPVPYDRALQVSAVYSCVELLANTMSTLPIFVYRRTADGGRVPDRASNLFTLLHDQPNQWMTPAEFVSVMVVNRLMRGNAYAFIERDSSGNPISLIPLPADQMEVSVVDGEVVYVYWQDGEYEAFPADSVVHWKGIGNGYIGLSKLEYMRASTNEAINAQRNASNLFAKNSKPAGVLQTEARLDQDKLKQILNRFRMMAEAGGSLFVVDRGLKYSPLSLTPIETQLLESRKYGVEEICRWFGVPPVLVGASGATTWGSGIAEIVQGFHKFTLSPLCTQFQQALMRRLIPLAQRDRYNIEIKFDALLKAAPQERAAYYSTMAQNGMMTRNEVRSLENLPPQEGGDALTAQSNLMPLEKLGQQTETGNSPSDGSTVRQ
jgi:HK97 family phage portal protein